MKPADFDILVLPGKQDEEPPQIQQGKNPNPVILAP